MPDTVTDSRRSRRLCIAIATSTVMGHCALSDGAAAQPLTELRTLDEIVITASRREGDLQSLASSISVVTTTDLENKGIFEFKDLGKAVAGIYVNQHENMTGASLRIRGVGTAGSSATDPSVGVIVDGVYQARPGAAFTELMDVERIEVLRGPQGTLFGKNTTSGVISIHTHMPDFHAFSGHLQAGIGNLSNREMRGMVNMPLIDGVLAARVNAFKVIRDGYTRNLFTGDDTNNVDRYGGRFRLAWQPADNFSLRFTAEYLDQKSDVHQGLVEYGLLDLGGTVRSYEEWYSILGAGELPPIGLGRHQQQASLSEDTVERYTLHMDWAVASHQLSSITALEKIDTSLVSDRDFSTLPLITVVGAPETEVFTQELQISSQWEGPLSYIIGGYYQKEDLLSETFSNGRVVSLTDREQVSEAVFASVTYELTDALSATAGVRYSRDEKTNVGIDRSFEEATYSLKLQYWLDGNRMIYFSHDKGYKSGGINRTVLFGDESRRVWDPELAYNYELGIKSEWLDNRLRLNGAMFYQTFEDYQVTTHIQPDDEVFLTLVTNAAEVTTKGVEMDMVALLTDHFTLNSSVAWISATYDEYQNSPCPTPSYPGCVNNAQDLSGKMLDNSPKWTANVGLEYRAALNANGVEWFARGDAAYRGRAALDQMLSHARQGAYTLYSARLGLEQMDSWKITVWGNNLGNKTYATTGRVDMNGLFLFQGLPRTYGITLDWYL